MTLITNSNALHLPIASKSVQCCVTSPPYYGLRDYGVDGQIGLEQSPEEYVSQLAKVFREVWRVLKDDGTLWVNIGDSYAGSGGAGGDYNKGGLKDGQPKYKSNFVIDRSKRNSKRWGGGNLPATGNLKPKDLIGIPWMVAFALRADGWYLRSDIIWSKPNPMPESVTDRPTKSHEYLFLLSKSAQYYYDAEVIKEESITGDLKSPRGRKGNIHRNSGLRKQDLSENRTYIGFNDRYNQLEKRNKRSVWEIPTQPTSYAHFATYPEKLVEPCILAGSKPGDYVLDPFSGSGTTGRVAIRHGRKYIGCELNFDYISDISKRRLTVQPYLSSHPGSE